MFVTYAAGMAVGVLVLLLGLFSVIALLVSVASAVRLAARGPVTTGTVTAVEYRQAGFAARVQVSYETPGGTFTAWGTSHRPWKGSPVPVRYDRSRPEHATTVTRPWRRAATALPVALLTVAAAAGMIIAGAWYFSGSHTPWQIPLLGASVTLGGALGCTVAATRRYTTLAHWRRMLTADGTVRRYADHSPAAGPGIQITFATAAGEKAEFWIAAGTVPAKVGDTLTVRYSPDRPTATATVREAGDLRNSAVAFTVSAAALAAFALYMYSML